MTEMNDTTSDLLWLGRAAPLRLIPSTPEAKRLARTAMVSFWSRRDGTSPALTVHDVIALGSSVPELHVTYIYSN